MTTPPPDPPQIGDQVLIGYDPDTNQPLHATVININDDGSWELEY